MVQTEETNLMRALRKHQQVGWASRVLIRSVVHLCAASMLSLGLWAVAAPRSFAGWISFPPYNEHRTPDAGAFLAGGTLQPEGEQRSPG